MATSTTQLRAFPTLEETSRHPAYPGTIWDLEPQRRGVLPVAKGRGGPVNIAWEIHGSGPSKVAFVMGLAMVKTSWQRQTRYFGHDREDQYSVLIFDNRGIGESDKPIVRYSTSEMAKDAIELLEHVGWTADRSVHLVGASLGGMIAQEMACVIPQRLRSLSLLCTSARVDNARGFQASVAEALGFLIPKTEERSIEETAKRVFVREWLEAPDGERLPLPGSTPRCGPAPLGESDGDAGDAGEYRLFDSNFQRFQAQEMVKRRRPGWYSKSGVICQLLAAAGHKKTAAQVKRLGDEVGRERVMVMHGNLDDMIRVNNGEKLIEMLEPGVGLIVEGMGHGPIMERSEWFNGYLEERFKAWEGLDEAQ